MQQFALFGNIAHHMIRAVKRHAGPQWRIEDDVLQNYNLTFISGGLATYRMNQDAYTVGRGSLLCYRPGDSRSATTSAENPVSLFGLDFSYTCPVFVGEEYVLTQPDLPFANIEQITDEHLIERLMHLFEAVTAIWVCDDADRMLRSQIVFTELMRELLLWKQQTATVTYTIQQHVNKVVELIGQNYEASHTLETLATAIGISPSYLCSIFKQATGKSPIQYLIEVRMRVAKQLLDEGCPVSETALRVGFSDIYYFSKAFKNHEGMSPSQYRKRSRGISQ